MKSLNLCKGFEMQMANGRFTGNFWGNFTYHNKNKDASTVDLAIISDNLFPLTDDLNHKHNLVSTVKLY